MSDQRDLESLLASRFPLVAIEIRLNVFRHCGHQKYPSRFFCSIDPDSS